jgi:hypothetical protein
VQLYQCLRGKRCAGLQGESSWQHGILPNYKSTLRSFLSIEQSTFSRPYLKVAPATQYMEHSSSEECSISMDRRHIPLTGRTWRHTGCARGRDSRGGVTAGTRGSNPSNGNVQTDTGADGRDKRQGREAHHSPGSSAEGSKFRAILIPRTCRHNY